MRCNLAQTVAFMVGVGIAGFGGFAGPTAVPGPVAAEPLTAYPLRSLQRPSRYLPGEVAGDLTSLADPEQRYAVYLPSSYDPGRRWPVAVLMHPRGNVPVTMATFSEAAERLGWVLISSYDTRSDVDGDPNTPALRAMLADAQTTLSIDFRRLYLVGFSGTARTAWYFADQLGDRVAGLISFGGGLPSRFRLPDEPGFAFFGAAGTTGFNHDEMQMLDDALHERGAAHRFIAFDGGHQWPPGEVCARALEWMELQAMRSGLAPPREAFLADVFERRLREARHLDEDGTAYAAWVRYRALAEDLDVFRSVLDAEILEEVARRRDALAASEEVRVARETRRSIHRRFREYLRRFGSALEEFRSASAPVQPARLAAELRLPDLRQEARDDDRMRALAARRLLETAYTNLSFYEARELLARDQDAKALVAYEVADRAKPDTPRVLLGMARIHAGRGDVEAALDSLERAAEVWPEMEARRLEDDPEFDPLQDDERFQELLRGLRRRR